MRRLLGVCLLAFTMTACGGSDAPTGPSSGQPPQGGQGQGQPPPQTSVAGTWSGTAVSTQIAGARFEISVVLSQTGTAITGAFNCRPVTASNCAAPVATVSGMLNGSALTAQVLLPGGVVACSAFNGTLSSTSAMAGTYTCGTADAGTWTLAK